MTTHRTSFIIALAALSATSVRAADAAKRVSFRNDVMAVLSKAGFNAGVCHGNASGKGGFKLSLRGQDPQADYRALTRDASDRRTNPVRPQRSLVLLKPTMQVAHEGGRRFSTDSLEYRILRAWIGGGLRRDADDVPRLTRLTVTPRRSGSFKRPPTAGARCKTSSGR